MKNDVLIPEPPRLWSSSVRYQRRGRIRMFDVSTDGARLALARVERLEGRVSPDHLAFGFNFFDHLPMNNPVITPAHAAPRSPSICRSQAAVRFQPVKMRLTSLAQVIDAGGVAAVRV